eukprot:12892148-Alexandrium_andersonii.AAC.1
MIGLEQGAVVGAALASPRLVELALAARVVQPSEAPRLSEAWRRLRAALILDPQLRPTGGSLAALKAA